MQHPDSSFAQEKVERETFVAKYNEVWESTLGPSFRCIECQSTVTDSTTQTTESLLEVFGGEYWHLKIVRPMKPDSYVVRNPNYSFRLTAKPDNKYLLAELEENRGQHRQTSLFTSPIADRTSGRTYRDIFNDSSTVFHWIRQIDFDGIPAYEVAFEFPLKSLSSDGTQTNGTTETKMRKLRCFLHRDKLLALAICSLIGEKPYTFYRHIRVYYDGLFEAPTRVVETSVKNPGKSEAVNWSTDYTVTKFDRSQLSESEFSLANFGLPEPISAKKTPTSWWPWMMGGSVLLLGIYLFLKNFAGTR